jgi:soluble lytic murein transglycosylase
MLSRFRDILSELRYPPEKSIRTDRSNGMRRFILLGVVSLAVVGSSPEAHAQEGTPHVEKLRKAGNGARFRVIRRIPPPRTIEIEKVAWPYAPEVREAVESDDWPAAWKILKEIEPDSDERFGFLWGWAAWKNDDWDRAEKAFVDVAEEKGLLADYAYRYAAESALLAGRYEDASAHAARVRPDSIPRPSAALVLGRALVRSGKTDEGIRALRAFLDAYPNDNDVPDARVELARALHAKGEHSEAARLLVKVRRTAPLWSGLDEDFEALEQSVFAKVPGKKLKKLKRRRARDYITEYRVRFSAHDSNDVIKGLSSPLEKWEKRSRERCEGLYMVGRSYTKLRKHSDSIPWYKRVVSECKGDRHYIRALYKGGKGYWNAGKKDEAYEFFEKMWSEFPAHSYADDGMYFASRILNELDRSDDAKDLLRKQVRKYPDGDMASNAHWLLVRSMFANNQYQRIVEYVDGLADTGERDLYSKGRLKYFRARALHKLGKKEAATDGYRDVIREYPMSFYALFALNRLAAEKGGSVDDVCAVAGGSLCEAITKTPSNPVIVDKDLERDGAFRRGKAFLQVSLDGFAALEFKRLRNRVGDEPEKLWTLAGLLDAAGAYPYSHNVARRHIDDWEDHYPDRRQAQRWQIAYPAPFSEEVTNWAKKRGIPRELVWAIMREESGFNPRIRSWAGAVGLMQLMPGTAKVAARKDGFKGFSNAKLTDPDSAVRLGTAYLDDLAERSGDHPVLMISGYNGGWGNVSNWLEDPDSNDLDLWVEDIPYGQTRHYTKRVLRSFWVYSWLYGKHRTPRFDLTVGD